MLPNIDDEPDAARSNLCHVAATYNSHPDLAGQIGDAIRRTDKPATVVSRWLRKADIRLTPASITRHRRGDCTCHD